MPNNLMGFLDKLEACNIFFKLSRIREGILVEIAVPGQRWEVEFMPDGEIIIEKFLSNGTIYDKNELNLLFSEFGDK